MNPAYSTFDRCLEAIATAFSDLNFRPDCSPSPEGNSEVLYRGIKDNTQHMVVWYLPHQQMIHTRVYDQMHSDEIKGILSRLGLHPKVGDQYLEFGKIDVDAFLN